MDLARFHRVKRRPVALRRHPGAARRDHPHRGLRQKRFDQQSVGHHTDVGTQAHQSDVEILRPRHLSQPFRQLPGAKGGFVDDEGLTQRFGNFWSQRPACCPFHTVDNRQIFALLRVEIVLCMGIPGGKNIAGRIFFDLTGHSVHNGLGLLCAQSSVDEIILHINDKQNLPHD